MPDSDTGYSAPPSAPAEMLGERIQAPRTRGAAPRRSGRNRNKNRYRNRNRNRDANPYDSTDFSCNRNPINQPEPLTTQFDEFPITPDNDEICADDFHVPSPHGVPNLNETEDEVDFFGTKSSRPSGTADNTASNVTIAEGIDKIARIKNNVVSKPATVDKGIDRKKTKSTFKESKAPERTQSTSSAQNPTSSKPTGPRPEDVKRAAAVVSSSASGGSSARRGANGGSTRLGWASSILSEDTRDAHISPSLYCGDLHPDVTESMLMEIFSTVGAIQSVRVCRDVVTRRSLGYAYINFFTVKDAKRALDTLNHFSSPLTKMRELRVMWKIRDPTMRKSGVGNIFVKGLHPSIDNKALHDTFASYGDILSSKVATDAADEPLGYGFVHFAESAQAQAAIDAVNGMFLKGRRVSVGRFQSRREREAAGHVTNKFTNIYVKNLPESLCDSDELRSKFAEFGEITSLHIPVEDDGEPRGFAFINYDSVEAAAAAVEELNGAVIDGLELYVGRAMKRAERDNELRLRHEQIRRERSEKYAGVNLYVKNLGDDVDEDNLRATFEEYGTVASCKVMKDERGFSRGFGFVCFSEPEEATKAVTELNGRLMGVKPIYVALAQHKDARKAQLEAQRAAAQRVRASAVPPSALYAQPSTAAYRPGPTSHAYGTPSSSYSRGLSTASAYTPHLGIPYAQPNLPVTPRHHPYGGGGGGGNPTRQPRRNRSRPTQDARRGYGPQPPHRRGPISASATSTLTLDMLTNATATEQKQMLGERLYIQVAKVETVLASKITGMLLELEMTEILHMLENPDALREQVRRAVDVLHKHEASMIAVSGSGSV